MKCRFEYTANYLGKSFAASLVRGVRGTWNFLIYLATQAQGCACEVHLSMDANMHRLQEEKHVVEILSTPFSPYVVLMRNELPR